ncbi:beta-ketoacyl synthase [Chitinophaga sp. SYP-B3965]|uniref:beta-ketoacyl synthase chain length factor n=1 Tax=Chitinophaga sp. SYP-B3965 TaxID=2663120 RepID=UPI001299B4D7|nr:beta-ketoacyl synthase chain length factor [Chitinophaga sp. SYP-B3965]MRG47404.1 beta-ketoacyl synthase [Chitinophaga sp. SYP-B3965]
MKGKYYIQSAAAISPQESFSGPFVPQLLTLADKNLLRIKEPDYSGFIPPNNLRRMSRVLKMGLVAALQCLRNSEVSMPGAIITGTGKGSLQDTERFLKNITEYAETALNPTPFIQSTYNSVNGLIAVQQKCTQYNSTFVHRGFSFEHALLDSMMQIAEGNADVVLTGAFEEISDEHFYIKSRIGYWKKALTQPAELLTSRTPGTIAGEGSAFFMLGSKPGNHPLACIEGIKMVYKPTQEKLHAALETFLAQHEITPSDIDLLITGQNGDVNHDHYYHNLIVQYFPATTSLPFKTLCGEYDTASAFALWLATQVIKEQGLKKILIYNNFYGDQHTFLLLSNS